MYKKKHLEGLNILIFSFINSQPKIKYYHFWNKTIGYNQLNLLKLDNRDALIIKILSLQMTLPVFPLFVGIYFIKPDQAD